MCKSDRFLGEPPRDAAAAPTEQAERAGPPSLPAHPAALTSETLPEDTYPRMRPDETRR